MVLPPTSLADLLVIATEPIMMPDVKSDPGGIHAAFFESDIPYPETSRLIKAWNAPPQVEWREILIAGQETIKHVYPYTAGTNNLGANGAVFPALNSYFQELRQGGIKPEVPPDVEYFQRMLVNVTTLVTPLLFARIGVDKFGNSAFSDAHLAIAFHHPKLKTITTRYENIFCEEPSPYMPKSVADEVITISGARSNAQKIAGLHKFTPLLDNIVGCDNFMDLHINFVAVHRGGIPTSHIASMWADEMGISNRIIGVDAKRTHDAKGDAVTGASITAPPGYAPSINSKKFGNAFIGPYDAKKPSNRKHDVHVFFDPMLATGVSTYHAILEYQEATKCDFRDIYVVALFAGSYDGIDKLVELGVNVHVMGVHDQSDLNSRGYIQPGLGDAGDKLFGVDKIESPRDFAEKMQTMYSNLAKHMPTMQKRLFNKFKDYTLQIANISLQQ